MRLYRGLTKPHRSEKIDQINGTNFTDCPHTALLYARHSRGELLVIDLPEAETRRAMKALWHDGPPERYIVYGEFDRFLVARLPAKDLRRIVGRKGGVTAHREYRSYQLSSAIEAAIMTATRLPIGTLDKAVRLGWPVCGGTLQDQHS